MASTSGGIASKLVERLLESGDFERAFLLDFDASEEGPARLKEVRDPPKVRSAAKSKYLPASMSEIIEYMKESETPNCVIVGTPCQIAGIKKYMERGGLPDKKVLFLGLFCDKTLNFNLVDFFRKKYGRDDERLVSFDYRYKKNGWPGDVRLVFDSGRELIVERNERMRLKNYFQLERCLFCLDKLNASADISLGDCYVPLKSSRNGDSSVIIRSKKGRRYFQKHKSCFETEECSIGDIQESQGMKKKRFNWECLRILEAEISGRPAPEGVKQAKKKLSERRNKISMGRGRRYRKIARSLFLSDIRRKAKKAFEIMAKLCILFLRILLDGLKRGRGQKGGENIVILGAQPSNKGSQSMLFTAVDELKRRFPKSKIYVFSSRAAKRKNKGAYAFEAVPWSFDSQIRLLGGQTGPAGLKRIEETVKRARFIVDISGFALSSQTGIGGSLKYMLNIMLAKKYSVPYYILPQSIGPFEYGILNKVLLYPLMLLYLRYPRKIFVREEQGRKDLAFFTRKNVEKKPDLVLGRRKYELRNIYKSPSEEGKARVAKGSVALVPNSRVLSKKSEASLLEAYRQIIDRVRGLGKNVMILRYSEMDKWLCEKLAHAYQDDAGVKYFPQEIEAIDLEFILGQMDFIVSSRYHGIVHAYNKGVPALSISWAEKYGELLGRFGQEHYLIKGEGTFRKADLRRRVDSLVKNFEDESQKIESGVKKISNREVFEALS